MLKTYFAKLELGEHYMVKGKQMNLTEKAKIIALAEQNVSNREKAFKTSFNESSV